MFHQALTTLTLHHRATRFYLVWTPVDADLEGQRVARVIAAEACLQDPPEGLHKVQSAAYQKARARERAFNRWEQDYHFDRAKNALQLRATGLPLDGAAFTHALPPVVTTRSGRPPLRWKRTSMVARHAVPSTPGASLPQPSNWLSTTPSRAPMRPGSDPQTLPSPYSALVAPHSAHPNTLPWSVGDSSNTV
jgi:hypothetical protein